MKKGTVKHILGTIWNVLLVWYTLPIFTIMIARLIIIVYKEGVDPYDAEIFEEFCLKNSRLLRFYKRVAYNK